LKLSQLVGGGGHPESNLISYSLPGLPGLSEPFKRPKIYRQPLTWGFAYLMWCFAILASLCFPDEYMGFGVCIIELTTYLTKNLIFKGIMKAISKASSLRRTISTCECEKKKKKKKKKI
jgi:hypothetical protein